MNDWSTHLKAFRKAHPSLSLKECMIKAKSSYKKGGRKQGGSSIIAGDQPNEIRRRIGRTAFRTQPMERVTK